MRINDNRVGWRKKIKIVSTIKSIRKTGDFMFFVKGYLGSNGTNLEVKSYE